MRSKNETISFVFDPFASTQDVSQVLKSSVTYLFPYIITSHYENIIIYDIRKPSLLWNFKDIKIKEPKYIYNQLRYVVYGRKVIFSNTKDGLKIIDLSNPAETLRNLVTVSARRVFYSGDYIGNPQNAIY